MRLYQMLKGAWRLVPASVREGAVRAPALSAFVGRFKRTVGTHDDLYSAEYYAHVDAATVRSAGVMAGSIADELAPASALDVGCGTGALLMALRERGVRGSGLEYSEAALAICRDRGLDVRKFNLEAETLPEPEGRYDVVVSMEVAEHLDARYADRFVDLLTRCGPVIVFTAATPGQGGNDHVNEQPHAYWIEKFERRGFRYEAERSLQWREAWAAGGAAEWYHRNLMLFMRL